MSLLLLEHKFKALDAAIAHVDTNIQTRPFTTVVKLRESLHDQSTRRHFSDEQKRQRDGSKVQMRNNRLHTSSVLASKPRQRSNKEKSLGAEVGAEQSLRLNLLHGRENRKGKGKATQMTKKTQELKELTLKQESNHRVVASMEHNSMPNSQNQDTAEKESLRKEEAHENESSQHATQQERMPLRAKAVHPVELSPKNDSRRAWNITAPAKATLFPCNSTSILHATQTPLSSLRQHPERWKHHVNLSKEPQETSPSYPPMDLNSLERPTACLGGASTDETMRLPRNLWGQQNENDARASQQKEIFSFQEKKTHAVMGHGYELGTFMPKRTPLRCASAGVSRSGQAKNWLVRAQSQSFLKSKLASTSLFSSSTGEPSKALHNKVDKNSLLNRKESSVASYPGLLENRRDVHSHEFYFVEVRLEHEEATSLQDWLFKVEVMDLNVANSKVEWDSLQVDTHCRVMFPRIPVKKHQQVHKIPRLDSVLFFKHVQKPSDLYGHEIQIVVHSQYPIYKKVLESTVLFTLDQNNTMKSYASDTLMHSLEDDESCTNLNANDTNEYASKSVEQKDDAAITAEVPKLQPETEAEMVQETLKLPPRGEDIRLISGTSIEQLSAMQIKRLQLRQMREELMDTMTRAITTITDSDQLVSGKSYEGKNKAPQEKSTDQSKKGGTKVELPLQEVRNEGPALTDQGLGEKVICSITWSSLDSADDHPNDDEEPHCAW